MRNPTLKKPVKEKSSNDLVYFLASLGIFIIMALLATDSQFFFR